MDEHSSYYDWCRKAWINNWAKEPQELQVWVNARRITQEEYEEIIALSKLL